MIDSHAEWVEQFYVCPSCHGRLEMVDEVGYRCVKECLNFPVLFGISDFRLLGSGDKAEDRRVSSLIEKFDDFNYEGLARFYMDSFGDRRAPDLWKESTERTVAALTVQTEKYEHMKIHLARTGIELMGKGSALELGCGTGGMVCILAQKFDRVVGLDAALDKLILAKKLTEQSHCINATFVCAYAGHLPFAHQTFSLVCAHDVIEHVGDQLRSLLQVRRTLETHGCFYFTIPNRYSLVGPEPHVGVWGVGFLPRRWASYYVKLVKGVPYEGKRLPSYLELPHGLKICFGYDFCQVYVLPDGALPAASFLGQAYRTFLRLSLISFFVNNIGRLIWGSFAVVCRRD
jgi:SAM-dependent methyltransferase